MKIHKEIVWNKGVNPKKDGEYMFIQGDFYEYKINKKERSADKVDYKFCRRVLLR